MLWVVLISYAMGSINKLCTAQHPLSTELWAMLGRTGFTTAKKRRKARMFNPRRKDTPAQQAMSPLAKVRKVKK